MTNESPYTVNATETSLEILETLIVSNSSLGVTELSDETGVSKGVVHNHLSTLRIHGYVVKDGRKYKPSLQLLALSEGVRRNLPVYQAAKEEVQNLAAATGETTILFVFEDQMGVPVYIIQTPGGWSPPFREGQKMPLHLNAAGKAILSVLSGSRLEATLDSLDSIVATESTSTTREELVRQIRQVRDDGIVFCRGEQFEDIIGVAAPISGQTETPAAIGIWGPTDRLSGRYLDEDIAGQVLSTGKSIQIELTKGKSS